MSDERRGQPGSAGPSGDGDSTWMARALDLAARGRGGTSPNPMVGAVIVRDGVLLSEGWHRRAGEPHAEIAALRAAAEAGHDVRGATLFVTLEPCCHRGPHKRTGPCTDAVIAAGLGRVVVAAKDPNPEVSGRGVDALRAAGIEVESGLMGDEAERLNIVFRTWIRERRPYVRLKLATSIDGRIAARAGVATAITGAAARARVHALRAEADAVVVGKSTVLVDDPRLTARDVAGDFRPPLRVVIDSHASVSADAAMFSDAPGGAMLITSDSTNTARTAAFEARGVEVLRVASDAAGRVDVGQAFARLAAREKPVTSILVEGGGALAASVVAAGLVDELIIHMAPIVLGAGGVGAFAALAGLHLFTRVAVRALGDDLELVFHPEV